MEFVMMSTMLSHATLMEEIAAWNSSTVPIALFAFVWKMAPCMNLLALAHPQQQQPQLDLAVPTLLGLEMAIAMTSTTMRSAPMTEETVAWKM